LRQLLASAAMAASICRVIKRNVEWRRYLKASAPEGWGTEHWDPTERRDNEGKLFITGSFDE